MSKLENFEKYMADLHELGNKQSKAHSELLKVIRKVEDFNLYGEIMQALGDYRDASHEYTTIMAFTPDSGAEKKEKLANENGNHTKK